MLEDNQVFYEFRPKMTTMNFYVLCAILQIFQLKLPENVWNMLDPTLQQHFAAKVLEEQFPEAIPDIEEPEVKV